MALTPDIAGFSRLITALDPWLDRVVIVGGWAHRLYHLHPSAQTLDFAPLMTLDADVALPPTLPAQTPPSETVRFGGAFLWLYSLVKPPSGDLRL